MSNTYTGRDNKGQTIVEFALILLLLVTILFGITEFGRAWYYSNALINGVRAGARYGSTLPNLSTAGSPTNEQVRDYTFAQITSVIPSERDVSLFVNVSTYYYNSADGTYTARAPNAGGTVTVIARQNFDILTGSIIPFFSGQRTLVRQATMSYQGT